MKMLRVAPSCAWKMRLASAKRGVGFLQRWQCNGASCNQILPLWTAGRPEMSMGKSVLRQTAVWNRSRLVLATAHATRRYSPFFFRFTNPLSIHRVIAENSSEARFSASCGSLRRSAARNSFGTLASNAFQSRRPLRRARTLPPRVALALLTATPLRPNSAIRRRSSSRRRLNSSSALRIWLPSALRKSRARFWSC